MTGSCCVDSTEYHAYLWHPLAKKLQGVYVEVWLPEKLGWRSWTAEGCIHMHTPWWSRERNVPNLSDLSPCWRVCLGLPRSESSPETHMTFFSSNLQVVKVHKASSAAADAVSSLRSVSLAYFFFWTTLICYYFCVSSVSPAWHGFDLFWRTRPCFWLQWILRRLRTIVPVSLPRDFKDPNDSL